MNRARIVDAAIEMIDHEGIEGVSMRKLGKALDAGAMSLYRHFRNKDELLDAVLDRLVDEVSDPPDEASWEDRLRAVARNNRVLAHKSPQLFPLLGRRRMRKRQDQTEPSELGPAEWLLDDLVSAGLPPEEALHAFRTVMAYTYGYALSEMRGFSLEPDPNDPEAFDIRQVDGERFPWLHHLAPKLVDYDHDAEFERGLDLILSAIRASAEPRQP
ncbi:MAG: TetR/AcrR family transcriptional regulator [Acidimicrobiia bacterium]